MANIEEAETNILNGIEIIKEVFYEMVNSNVFDTGVSIASSSSKVIKLIQTFKDLPSQLFCKKLIRFLNGVKDIQYDKRKKFIENFGEQLNKNYERILNTINNVDDEKKCDYLSNLFKALVYEEIDFTMFLRLCKCVEKTLSEDLEFIQNNIEKQEIEHSPVVVELVYNNLLLKSYQTFASLEGNLELDKYKFTDLALKLYKYGLNTKNSCIL